MTPTEASLAMPFLCARPDCRAPIQNPKSSGEPFREGAHKGGYLCRECWILEWDENSWNLADESTREWAAEEASRIRSRRETSELLFRDGLNMAHLTARATVRLCIEKSSTCSADEYDPARLIMLQRAIAQVVEKMGEGWAVDLTIVPPVA